MTMDSNPLMHEDESINIFFEGMSVFRSRWNVLNERCKKLEASLQEARIEKEQLRVKLALSRDYTQKIEKEKDELAIVVQELHKDLQQNSLLKWIETLGEKISVLNNSAPKVTGNNVSRVIDDITLLSSDDENDLLPNDNEESHEIRRNESCTIRARPNSTCSDLTDHDYPLAKSTTLNQTTASAGSEVSVVDTMVSIENSPRRDSNEDYSLSDTPAVCSDEISHVDVPTSLHNSPVIVPLVERDVPSIDIKKHAIDGDISENKPLSSQQLTPSVSEESLSYDLLVDAQPSPEPTSEQISSKKAEMSSRKELISCSNDEVDEVQSITTSEKLPPPDIEETEVVKLSSSRTLPQINIKESESTSNKGENTSNIENSKTSVSSPGPSRLISIADMSTSTNEKKSTDSTNDSTPCPPSLKEYSSDGTTITDNRNFVENDIEITKSSRDATGDAQQAAESYHGHFLDFHSEILNKNGIDLNVSLSDQRHVQFTSEALLQQGVNHEEVLPAEETPSENVPDTESSEERGDSDTFETTNRESDIMKSEISNTDEVTNHRSNVINGEEKSTNQKATPEELISQIFGSPMTSPDHDPDVICISNVPNDTINLNMSDEESSDTGKHFASIVQPELTVNLPRIFAPGFKVTEESVNTVTSYLTSETKTTENGQTELSNSKRSRSPSPSTPEPKAKRSSPSKSIELEDNFVSEEKKIMKCLFCGSDEEFDCYSALDTHIIAKHPNPYPYYFRCRYGRGNCRRHFRTTKKVNDHIRRRHFGEDLSLPVEKLYPGQKPWKCSICDKIFAHSSHLRGHLRHIHNVTETEGIAKYEFKMHVRKVKRRTVMKSPKNGCSVGQCIICLNDEGSSEKFKTYQDLDEHIFRNHENPYPFYLRCPFCKNENVRHFKGLSWLNNHIENNHWSKVSPRTNN